VLLALIPIVSLIAVLKPCAALLAAALFNDATIPKGSPVTIPATVAKPWFTLFGVAIPFGPILKPPIPVLAPTPEPIPDEDEVVVEEVGPE
jgi:hypothetical protein